MAQNKNVERVDAAMNPEHSNEVRCGNLKNRPEADRVATRRNVAYI
jgi:hypothetical protein